MFEKALSGGRIYWGWIILLLAFIAVGVVLYIQQLSNGLEITGMSRDVSWGLYIANFTFLVGVAASAVMVVLPYYLHNYKEFGMLTTFGEFLAVPAVMMCVMFIMVDLGQPGRALNLILHPSPNSVLFWDMIVLSGYLLLNLAIGWYVLDARHKNEAPRRWVKPLIYISIPWAISIHTVTAFIYSGLAAKPFWLSALMAPRFLASAFASGPALLIIALLIIKRFANFDPGGRAIQKLSQIMLYGTLVTVFFFLVESFTVFYGNVPEHMDHFWYLLKGLEGETGLVPWMWTTIVFWVGAITLLLLPRTRGRDGVLVIAAVLIFVAMWIDKGLVLLVPGFFPSATGGLTEYLPTLRETFITLGVWAVGFLVLTVLYKIATSVMSDIRRDRPDAFDGH